MANDNVKRNPIEFAIWANELALFAGFLMLVGGIICQFDFPRQDLGIYSAIAGGIIFFFEWARGKRQKGATMTRAFQHVPSALMSHCGFFAKNYFFRGLLYLGLCVPTFFELPAIIGGAVLAVAGLIYILAAFRQEKWTPVPPPSTPSEAPKPKILEAPSKPPPRLIHRQQVSPEASQPPKRDEPTREEPNVMTNPLYFKNYTPAPTTAPPPLPPSDPTPSKPAVRNYTPAPTTAPPPLPPNEAPNSKNTVRPRPRGGPSVDTDSNNSLPSSSFSSNAPQPAKKPSVKPRVALQKQYDWESTVDPGSGETYFYNTVTGETSWSKPPGWDQHASSLQSDS